MNSKRIYFLLAIISFFLYSCSKDESIDLTNTNTSDLRVLKTDDICSNREMIFEKIKDESISDGEITQTILNQGTTCEEVLKELINSNSRVINERDLGIILIFNSQLSNDILYEIINGSNREISVSLIEKILAYNLPLSPMIEEVVNARSDIRIPEPDVNFNIWFNENEGRLDSVTLDEIQEFEFKPTQREIFKILPNEAKRRVLLTKIESVISDNEFTGDRLEYLNRIYREFESFDFTYDEDGLPTSHSTLEELKQQGELLFLPYQFAIISNEFNNDIIQPLNSGGGGGGSGASCECNTSSDYCGGIFDTFPGSCSGSCGDSSQYGCGFLWSYSCEGTCQLTI